MRGLCLWAAGAMLIAPLIARAGDDSAAAASAGKDVTPATTSTDTTVEETPAGKWKTSYELDANGAYVGSARTQFGGGRTGEVSEGESDAKLVLEPQYNDGPIYRFGLAYQRYNFGFSRAAPMPNVLQSENVVLGMDFTLFNSWLVRVEADPGFYNDGRAAGNRSFNAPFSIGGSYIASDNVQWVVGLEVDVNRQIPVFPAVGVRWQLNDQWVLDAILPTPRLEYDYSKAVTFYVGADVDDGTYRVDDSLGQGYDDTYTRTETKTTTKIGVVGFKRPAPLFPAEPVFGKIRTTTQTKVPSRIGSQLGGAIVEYDELKLGAGVSYKASKAVTFEMEAGYLPYREFDFHRADQSFSNKDGAAYGQISLDAQF
jgi:hypothetical protein